MFLPLIIVIGLAVALLAVFFARTDEGAGFGMALSLLFIAAAALIGLAYIYPGAPETIETTDQATTCTYPAETYDPAWYAFWLDPFERAVPDGIVTCVTKP